VEQDQWLISAVVLHYHERGVPLVVNLSPCRPAPEWVISMAAKLLITRAIPVPQEPWQPIDIYIGIHLNLLRTRRGSYCSLDGALTRAVLFSDSDGLTSGLYMYCIGATLAGRR
jgi:hypothetical protein